MPATDGQHENALGFLGLEAFHRGPGRSNDTHASTTDPDARLYRKSSGQPARLCYLGHIVMENRNGLLVDAELTRASGWAERAAAEAMIETVAPAGGVTLGTDKAYDTAEHVANLRRIGVTPHVAQNTNGRRTRHPGYAMSQSSAPQLIETSRRRTVSAEG